MPRKKKESPTPKEEMKKRWAIVDKDMWDITPVNWSALPEEILDFIPGEFIYNIPTISKDGSISEGTYVYIHEVLGDEGMSDLSEIYGGLKILSSDDYNYELVIPSDYC